MNRLEDELRWALQRREPPPDFADRVMARIPQPWHQRFFGGIAFPRAWAPVAAALALAAVVGTGTWEYRRTEQRREGERAAQELRYALQVTSAQLEMARSKLLRTTGGSI